MTSFAAMLNEQRWDDHRYYHHSLVNQSLHMLSACTFVCCYAMAFWDPALATVIGWTVAMVSRQTGHFFFEPKGYDEINQATHEHKEDIKVGYNLSRKWVLMTAWVLSPLLLLADPSLFGLLTPHHSALDFVRNVGWLWLAIGVAGLVGRTVQLFFIRDVQTGIVWFTKILTDPFNDIRLYHRAPLRLFRGERMDGPRAAAH